MQQFEGGIFFRTFLFLIFNFVRCRLQFDKENYNGLIEICIWNILMQVVDL